MWHNKKKNECIGQSPDNKDFVCNSLHMACLFFKQNMNVIFDSNEMRKTFTLSSAGILFFYQSHDPVTMKTFRRLSSNRIRGIIEKQWITKKKYLAWLSIVKENEINECQELSRRINSAKLDLPRFARSKLLITLASSTPFIDFKLSQSISSSRWIYVSDYVHERKEI